MSQKSSGPQADKSVSQALMPDKIKVCERRPAAARSSQRLFSEVKDQFGDLLISFARK
jgi:hypothetical protein